MIEEKQLLLDEIKDNLNPNTGFILTSYAGIKANDFAEFRDGIASAGGNFIALKKRVFQKAAKDLNLTYELNELEGHVGLIVSEDSFLTTTKALFKFKKDSAKKITILGGHYEGRKCLPQEFEEVSNLPTLDEMRAQFVGLLEAPMTQTLGVMQSLLTSVAYCLQNKANKES